jgi:putative spermidine/putrescine transport system substrate-binding protein
MDKNGANQNRRTFLATAGVAAVAAAIPGLASSQAGVTLTVADPGGPYGPAFRKAFYDPFERASGIKVVNVARESEPTAQFKAIVEAKSYIWDVSILTLSARDILLKQHLLEPINLETKDTQGLLPDAISTHWLGTDVVSTNFAFRKDKVRGAGPNSWADFWDVKRFPGRRALRSNPIDTLEQALLADGVPLDKLYPLDVDRAFRSLDRIKPHVAVWWTSGAQATQLIQSGEVDFISIWNGRAQSAIDAGAPVELVWNQGLYSIEGWGIPRGSPRAAAARQFVRFCAGAAQQAAFTTGLAYGPTNLNAYRSIPLDRARVLPTFEGNLKVQKLSDEAWWSENRAAVNERFSAWIIT